MARVLEFLAIALAACGVALVVIGVGRSLQARWIRHRLDAESPAVRSGAAGGQHRGPSRRWRRIVDALSRLSLPRSGPGDPSLQMRLVRAGWRQAQAVHLYFAAKTGLALAGLLAAGFLLPWIAPSVSGLRWVIMMIASALVLGFLPDLAVRQRRKGRAERMQDSLPDFIDLLVICTESGLGMDAAISKVVREMMRSSPELAEEFHIMSLEVRAGAPRMVALRQLAQRVDLEDLYDLVSMLVQADRFGTSLAASLRIQSEVMRTRRMQRAEEIAARIPVKMLLPLVLFIFPVLLIVLLGPAMLQMRQTFSAG